MFALRLVSYAWALPNSLIGLALSLLFKNKRILRGVLVCEGADWPRRLGWGYRAITLGHVILGIDELDDRILAHEFAHVHQHEIFGPFFLPSYFLATLWAVVRGRHYYRDNAFESSARRRAEEAFPSI
jgi:hypothetical protein